MSSKQRSTAPGRDRFVHYDELGTRWLDNDSYGHINNVVYYEYFDTRVNAFLMQATGCDIRKLPQIGIVAETACRFFSSLSFPQSLEIGLAVERLGERSIEYRIGVFAAGSNIAAALGRFVHVYVEAHTRTLTPIPDVIRSAVTPLVVADSLWN